MERVLQEHVRNLSGFEVVIILTNKLPADIRKKLEMQTVETPREPFALLRSYYPADTVLKDADTVQKDQRLRLRWSFWTVSAG